MNKISVVDTPKKASDQDQFGMGKYQTGLVKFIENTNTPITIALQGEWGSGKTSLMNTLKDELCDKDGKRYHPIWLNTWQYSLMKEAEEALVSIIKGLTEEVLNASKNKSTKFQETKLNVSKVFGKVFKETAKIAVKATTSLDVGSVVDAFSTENKSTTVLQLRDALNEAIKIIIEEDDKDGFIFFIDDLDRIDPPVAVEILELLKNIFDLENCVFILAIDYDVVIKGLEPKFGKLTEKNEREFRSFFDKIIQLPFSMPVASYEIDNFLITNLKNIDFINEEQSTNKELAATVSDITRLAVGTNPRGIKRLLNSLSLISCINNKENNQVLSDIIINFALVNIQIAYPAIYKLLLLFPNFTEWDEKIALQMNLTAIEEHVLNKLDAQDEFDEVWEKVLFRVCERDYYLKKKALYVSRLLNNLREVILGENEDGDIGKRISQIILLSSVTNIEAFEEPVTEYHRGTLLKNVREMVLNVLKQKMPEISNTIVTHGNRVQSNAFFIINNHKFRFHTYATENGPRLLLIADYGVNIESLMKLGLLEKYDNIKKEFLTKLNTVENIGKFEYLGEVSFFVNTDQRKAEGFYSDEIIEIISEGVYQTYMILCKLDELIEK